MAVAAANGGQASGRIDAAGIDLSLDSPQAVATQRLVRVAPHTRPGSERAHRIYDRMNRRARELRQERAKGNPNLAVIADLERKLRLLASQL